jgi:hypothetical protein
MSAMEEDKRAISHHSLREPLGRPQCMSMRTAESNDDPSEL